MIPLTCEFGWWISCESDPFKYLNQARLAVAQAHGPNGVGVKDLHHYAQVIGSQKFQYYDYGAEENQKHYNQDTPPLIPLENIKNFPIGLFVGETDLLATVVDNAWL